MGYYIPKTFFVEKLGVSGIDSYIDKQKKDNSKKEKQNYYVIEIYFVT